MKGYQLSPPPGPPPRQGALMRWETLVVDAVGSAIEFWGFKLNHGRTWALLYLRDNPLTAQEIQHALGLSKGAVSMVTRELEGWGVVHRVRGPSEAIWKFQAEVDLMKMIGRVVSEREARFLERIEWDLAQAEKLAREAKAPAAAQQRIARMRTLAKLTHQAVGAFLATARLDVRALADVLKGTFRRK
ncbi:MAG: GbsR/MarR family transcriptional regulator [Myxococcaceae bacterium]